MFESRVIVGRIPRQTPLISANILAVNLLPTWRVPPGITKRDMMPKLRSDPGFFERENFRIFRASDGQVVAPGAISWESGAMPALRFEQAPGPKNALGLIRLDMPNKYTVYLHDTPTRNLFDRPARPFSSGCVRVDKITDLALWLTSDLPSWNAKSFAAAISTGQPKSIKLSSPVPAHFIYLTGWVEPDGDVNFREDIYNKDKASSLASSYEKRTMPAQPFTP